MLGGWNWLAIEGTTDGAGTAVGAQVMAVGWGGTEVVRVRTDQASLRGTVGSMDTSSLC